MSQFLPIYLAFGKAIQDAGIPCASLDLDGAMAYRPEATAAQRSQGDALQAQYRAQLASAQQAASTAATNDTTLRQRLAAVQAAHRAYIANASPSAAQRKTWEDNVARNLIALNRLLLGDMTGAD